MTKFVKEHIFDAWSRNGTLLDKSVPFRDHAKKMYFSISKHFQVVLKNIWGCKIFDLGIFCL